MTSQGRPLEPVDVALGRPVRGAKAFLMLPEGVYIARLELEYVGGEDTALTKLWHIVAYVVTDKGDRKISDAFTTMEIFESDLSKKKSHSALKSFVEDPEDVGVRVQKAWPTHIYKVRYEATV
jgi:hypothetical protein